MKKTEPDTWQVQDAKARFSEFLDAAKTRGPQVVTRRGVEEAVLLPIEDWRRLSARAPLTLKDWLLAPTPRFEDGIEIPPRGKQKFREPPNFDD
jgi:prevent-host-death family protein